MSSPTREDIKKAAEWCVNKTTCLGCPSDSTSTAFCRERFARAYLALREQVETVALPALKRIEPILDVLELFSPGGAEDGSIDKQIRAAIKAIEEGRDEV